MPGLFAIVSNCVTYYRMSRTVELPMASDAIELSEEIYKKHCYHNTENMKRKISREILKTINTPTHNERCIYVKTDDTPYNYNIDDLNKYFSQKGYTVRRPSYHSDNIVVEW